MKYPSLPVGKMDKLAGAGFMLLAVLLVLTCVWAYRQFITSPPYVDPERYPVRGIDVSRHNGMMNLDAAAAEGVEFIFIKASEGGDFRDENFRLNYQKARHAGMKIGAYHFFRFDRDGIEQATSSGSIPMSSTAVPRSRKERARLAPGRFMAFTSFPPQWFPRRPFPAVWQSVQTAVPWGKAGSSICSFK